MDVDWSVELGADDHTLEFPWEGQGSVRYRDLKNHPELVDSLEEVKAFPELSSALSQINALKSPLLTAKCDVWMETELGPSEEVYGASLRLCSYVDVIFEDDRRFSFIDHEAFIKAAAKSASTNATPAAAAVEFVLRRCFFRQHALGSSISGASPPPDPGWRDGFYVTVYVFGYGVDPEQARSAWVAALGELTRAMLATASSME